MFLSPLTIVLTKNNVYLQILMARNRAVETVNTRARKKALDSAIDVGILAAIISFSVSSSKYNKDGLTQCLNLEICVQAGVHKDL